MGSIIDQMKNKGTNEYNQYFFIFFYNFLCTVSEAKIFSTLRVNIIDNMVKISDIGLQCFMNYDMRKMTLMSAYLSRSWWNLYHKLSSIRL